MCDAKDKVTEINVSYASRSFDSIALIVAMLLLVSGAQAQNLFVADWQSGRIYTFTPEGTQLTFASGLSGPIGLAFNSSGDLFVAENGGDKISRFTTNGLKTTFVSGLHPRNITFNSVDELFVADYGYGHIYKITTNGVTTTFASGLINLTGIAFDSHGNLFVCHGKEIIEITPSGVQSVFVTLSNSAYGLAFDCSGDLFVTGRTNIIKVTQTGHQSIFLSGLMNANAVCFDSANNLFVSDGVNNLILKVTPATELTTFASGLDAPTMLAFQGAALPVPSFMLLAESTAGASRITILNPLSSAIVQCSTNLADWWNIYTNTPPFTFTDSLMSGSSPRFYRALLGQ